MTLFLINVQTVRKPTTIKEISTFINSTVEINHELSFVGIEEKQFFQTFRRDNDEFSKNTVFVLHHDD